MCFYMTRRWFPILFIFTRKIGEMIRFDQHQHIFQVGWNHQLVLLITNPKCDSFETEILRWDEKNDFLFCEMFFFWFPRSCGTFETCFFPIPSQKRRHILEGLYLEVGWNDFPSPWFQWWIPKIAILYRIQVPLPISMHIVVQFLGRIYMNMIRRVASGAIFCSENQGVNQKKGRFRRWSSFSKGWFFRLPFVQPNLSQHFM